MKWLALLVSVALVAVSEGLVADSLTPATYVQLDIEAREMTLEGMASRVVELENGISLDRQLESAEQRRKQVESVFTRHGTSGAKHAAYGTRHAAEVTGWLEEHPEWQARYGELNARFEVLVRQLDALQEGN